MKKYNLFAVAGLLVIALPFAATAQSQGTSANVGTKLSANSTAITKADGGTINTTADMSDGEVRKIDKDSQKITLKHGEIKNLGMPGMTMVFKVRDSLLLDKVHVGSKVKFAAEGGDGAIYVTAIEAAN